MINLKLGFIIIIIAIIPLTSSFGITPAQQIIEYEPETEQKFSFSIINSENKKINLVLLPQGELNRSIALSNYSISLTPEISSITIEYSVKIPKGLSPGKHNAEILILEIPEAPSSELTYIGSIVGIITKTVIEVPYPGKYAESGFGIESSEEGKVNFVIPLVSKGNLDIARAKAVIDIFTPLNEKIVSITTQEISLASGERKELAAQLEASQITPGKYLAVATILYDESTLILEREFSIGNDGISIKNIEVNDFSLGEIAKFEFLLENNQNFQVEDAYILMQVLNNEGDIMAEFKSATYNLPPFGSELLVAFWDTEGVKTGTYDAKAFINFGQSSIQKELTLDISNNDITVVGVGYVIKSGSSNGSLTTILIIAIAVLVILNLTWFLILRKKVKNK
ncbi:MAG: hypothetical protein AABW89_01135 [Nanoarchaeota archaeon]